MGDKPTSQRTSVGSNLFSSYGPRNPSNSLGSKALAFLKRGSNAKTKLDNSVLGNKSTPSIAEGIGLGILNGNNAKAKLNANTKPAFVSPYKQDKQVGTPKLDFSEIKDAVAKVRGEQAPAGFDYSQTQVAPTPSTVNTAAPLSSSQVGSTDPASAYLAREQALVSSGQGTLARAVSAQRNATQPSTLQPTFSTQMEPRQAQPTSRVNDPFFLQRTAQNKLTALQQNYLSTLTPSERENALQAQLTDLQGATQMGISNEEGQGRLKTLNLVRGRQGKLLEQGNLQAQTVSNQLANEQAQRAAQADVMKTQLGFAQTEQQRQDELIKQQQGQDYQRQQDEYQQQQDERNFQVNMLKAGYQEIDPSQVTDPSMAIQIGSQTYLKPSPQSEIKEVGGSLVSVNPDGTVSVLYQGQQSGGDSFSLSPGQTRYDAYGNVIATAGTSTSSLPNSVNESIADSQTLLDLMSGVTIGADGSIPGVGLVQGRLPLGTLSTEGQNNPLAIHNLLSPLS